MDRTAAPTTAPTVAAGHPLTLRAARDALAAGGNAFDAAVAAGFTAAVAEPTLSSLAGGGFLLAAPAGGDPVLFDFFVDVPGRAATEGGAPASAPRSAVLSHGEPVTIRFKGAEQVFHVGEASVATPGCLAGYLHVHARLGRLPLGDLVRPAARLAREGVVLGRAQGDVVRLLAPIMAREPLGAARFAGPDGATFDDAQPVVGEELAAFLDDVAEGRRTSFADPDLAPAIVAGLAAGGGTLTMADLVAYRVIEREPLAVALDGVSGTARFVTNPAPSFGGDLIAQALAQVTALPADRRGACGDGPRLVALADALATVTARHRRSRGTTHVSIRDAQGNVASMTTSNGSNSGVHLAGTGVMANNIMGEEDLHPAGAGAAVPGTRVGSMMAPSLLLRPGRPAVVLGSGGSERIRSALTQVITALVLDDLPLREAVLAPRLHVDDTGVAQLEPGFEAEAIAELAATRRSTSGRPPTCTSVGCTRSTRQVRTWVTPDGEGSRRGPPVPSCNGRGSVPASVTAVIPEGVRRERRAAGRPRGGHRRRRAHPGGARQAGWRAVRLASGGPARRDLRAAGRTHRGRPGAHR
jgi:gamma-glutamyltranspeptidase / glutathione hydrolase